MDFSEYQLKAGETAVYPNIGNNLAYPTLGLCGEAGEVAEKVKKMYRDDGGFLTAERAEALEKEIGQDGPREAVWKRGQQMTEKVIVSGIVSSDKEDKFETGAVRDVQENKGRLDLLPVDAIIALSQHFENGAKRYAARNWEKGIPLSIYLNSALRHTLKLLRGDTDEDHMSAAAWNILCYGQTKTWIEQGILPESLDDLPKRQIVKKKID